MSDRILFSTHISYDSADFSYKDKSRWPELRSFIYDVKPYLNNCIFDKEILLQSNHLGKTVKKRIETLKIGGSCYAGSNGGNRSQYIRRLTDEDIALLEEEKKIDSELQELKEELKRLNPELIKNINLKTNKLQKHRNLLKKERLQ